MSVVKPIPPEVLKLFPTENELYRVTAEIERLREMLVDEKQSRPQYLIVDGNGTSHHVILHRQAYKAVTYKGDFVMMGVTIYTYTDKFRKTTIFDFHDNALSTPLRVDHGWPAVIEILTRVTA